MLVTASSLRQDGLYLLLLPPQPVSDPACVPLMGTVPSWLAHTDLRGLLLPIADPCSLVPRPA